MKRSTFVGSVLVGVAFTWAAVRDANADDWRLGVDSSPLSIIATGPHLGGLLGGGGATTSAELAYRVSEAWWLWVDGGIDVDAFGEVSNAGGFVTLGLRWVANPDDRVRVGWSVGLSGSVGESELAAGEEAYVDARRSLGLELGVTTDITLTDHLDLRLGVDFMSVAYVVTERTGPDLDQELSGLSFSLGLRPQLGLGLTF